jgi:long-subunit acyl-CoA synthetase (AMP-forming)
MKELVIMSREWILKLNKTSTALSFLPSSHMMTREVPCAKTVVFILVHSYQTVDGGEMA